MPSAFDLLFAPRASSAAPARAGRSLAAGLGSPVASLPRPHGLRQAAPGSSYTPDADEYDLQRGTACKRGYDRQWRNVRAAFLARHPKCECGAPATLVDHIVKVRVDPSRRLDPNNLQGMCRSCHGYKSAAGL